MFENDDLDPRTKKPVLRKLDNFSLSELDEYIIRLKAEIVRAEEEIKRKRAASEAASTFFKA